MGDDIRPGPDGRGVPKIQKVSWKTLNSQTRGWEPGGSGWLVSYPNEFEWDCCRQTESQTFYTWRSAIEWALSRPWER